MKRLALLFFFIPILLGYSHTFAEIPRDELRLELLLATGSQDTSGNNRLVTATGVAPSYQIDPVYGIPYAQFSGSGWLRVNTSWSAGASDDFSMSVWIKISDNNLINNQSANLVPLTSTFWNAWWNWIGQTYYDKPMVILSTKTGTGDSSNFRLALSKEWKCSINNAPRSLLYFNVYSSAVPYHGDIFSILDASFDCASLKDGKWHNVILTRKSSTIRMYLDWNSIWSAVSNLQFSRNWSFWEYAFPIDNETYKLFPLSIKDAIYNSHFYKWWMAWYRLYSRAITDSEIDALMNEYLYTQSDLIGAGNITLAMERYAKPNLSMQLKSIAPNLSKDMVDYQYSTDGKIFSGITDITDISASTGSLSYRVSLNLSSVPDGKVNITLRVKSGETYQNIGSVSFSKIDSTMTITINQPNSDTATSKNISAATEAWNILYMSQTRWTICDGTITTWEDYSDLTFTNKNDNGIRICYKAVNTGINKTIYKLSAAIQGVQSTEDQKTKWYNLFANYTLWTKSAFPKSDDSTAMILELLGVSSGQSQGTINGITMTDINGDGLVDFLYSRNDPIRRAIMINNGNYTFRTVYRCAVDGWPSVYAWVAPAPYVYYWDCADSTR